MVRSAAAEVKLGTVFLRDWTCKDDGSLVTATDLRMQSLIFDALRERWPHLLCMGEEMEHAEQSTIFGRGARGFWVLDPLDGTTNFSSGFPFFGTSLALVIDGRSRLGVVYDPIRDECFHGIEGQGAYLNGEPLKANQEIVELGECVANVDYKRLVSRMSERLVRYGPYRSQRNLGSCVLEWCWLAAGRIQLYLHGGQKMWDYAAGSLILNEAGGTATSFDGCEIDCSRMTKRNVIAAINPTLYQSWFDWLEDNEELVFG